MNECQKAVVKYVEKKKSANSNELEKYLKKKGFDEKEITKTLFNEFVSNKKMPFDYFPNVYLKYAPYIEVELGAHSSGFMTGKPVTLLCYHLKT